MRIARDFAVRWSAKRRQAVERIRSARYVAVVTISHQGGTPMAIHLTPTELARESGLERRDDRDTPGDGGAGHVLSTGLR